MACFSKLIDFAVYPDDNTPYTNASKMVHILTNLQGASEKLFHRFSVNHLVKIAETFHPLTSSYLPVDIRITYTNISNEERGKLLEVNFEVRFSPDYHVNKLLKIASTTLLRDYSIIPWIQTPWIQITPRIQITPWIQTLMCSNEYFYNISVFLLSSSLHYP